MRLEPHSLMLDGAVPIPAGALVAYLAARPREARAFVLDLAHALIQEQDALDTDPDLEPSFGYLPNGAVLDECEPDDDLEATNEDGNDGGPDAPLLPKVLPRSIGKRPKKDGPQFYAVRLRGRCMEPVYRDGELLIVDRDAPVRAGDFVSISYIAEHQDGSWRVECWLKRLAADIMPGIPLPFPNKSEIAPLLFLEMLNPPEKFFLDCRKVFSVHKVIGRASDYGVQTTRNTYRVRRRLETSAAKIMAEMRGGTRV